MNARLVVCISALAVSCRVIAVRQPPPGEALSAEQALARVARRGEETETLRALFRMTLTKPDGARERSSGALVVSPPDRLRLQIFSAGFFTVYDYTASGDRFRVRRPLEGHEEIGRFSDLAPGEEGAALYDLRPLFLGDPLSGSHRIEDEGDRYRVIVGSEDARHEIEVSKRDGRIEREILYSGGEVRLRARYDDFRPVDGVLFPFHIDVEYPTRSVSLEIEITRYTRNESAAPEIFDIR